MNYLKKELYELIKSDSSIFDLIQDISLDGLCYWDIENPENEWLNPRFWLTLGYNSHEIPDSIPDWQHIIHPDDFKSIIDNFNAYRENPVYSYDQVIRYTHKNGSTVWMRFRGVTTRNKEGKSRILGTYTDITKEKESEENHKLIFNSIDEGFCIIEMIFDEHQKPIDYRFLVINTAFEKQTGLCDAVGKRMREFAPNHEEHWFETYGRIALTGEPIRFENRAEQLNQWYDVYAFRFGEPKNFQVGILFNNVSERKQADETIKLLNQELVNNLAQLDYSNNELESFTYSVSHDLRAPLRAINGHATILTEDFSEQLSPEAKKSVDAICRNSQKMGNLIDDLLTFSRLGRKDIEKYDVDTESIVKNIVEDICNQHAIDKSIFHIGNMLPAYGDYALLKQVWINLISNAFKYSRKNTSACVEIGSLKHDDDIMYYVKDNGVGFDMKYYDKLFGVFQRLHGDDEFEGTGVGLAIVQRIVVRHGGKVWAEASINQGASFYFTIPIVSGL